MAFQLSDIPTVKTFQRRYPTTADAEFIWYFMGLYFLGVHLGTGFAADAMKVMNGVSEQEEAALAQKYERKIVGDFFVDLRDAHREWRRIGRMSMEAIETAAFKEFKKVERRQRRS